MPNSSLSPAQAAREILRRRKIRSSLLAWCETALEPLSFKPATHHRLLIDELEKVARGETKRLAIFMPPGSAKSTYASKLFPAWYMAQNPNRAVIGASHTANLAEDFSKEIQGYVRDHSQALGLGVATEPADLWRTTNGGRYKAIGVGGAIAGSRADLAIIDDPVKTRQDADSETYRERAWKWFTADLRTRLKPGAPIILIQCMTGDTPVLQPDGSEKALRDIQPGDTVATYRDGQLATSKVVNWINHGPDHVFKIRMTSGRIVRANARHPFLVSVDGVPKWIRLKDLRPGLEIFRVSGASGKARPAPMKAAKGLFRHAATALLTTTKNVGQMACGLLRSMPSLAVLPTLSIATASPRQNTIDCTHSRMVCARFAGSRLGKMCAPIGAASFVSTIATIQAAFERCFATTATSLLDISRQRKRQTPSLNICDFTLDRIMEISPAGSEDVFDIQVEETENFIANGLVSHNTRWHQDDLGGRLLETQRDRWKVISLPATAVENDPLGRQPGDMLWSDDEYGYGAEIAAVKAEYEQSGAMRDWYSLYEQNPRPNEGALFKVEQIEIVDVVPTVGRAARAWDLAATKQVGTRDPDWTVGLKMARLLDGRPIILDVVRLRDGPDGVERAILNTAGQDGRSVTISLPQDPGQAGKAQAQHLTRKLHGYSVVVTPETGDKATRAAPVASQINVGNVLMLRAPWNRPFLDELAGFPSATKDDQVDALSRAFSMLAESSAVERMKALAS